ncbi:enoyl-CoA hydratase/isomerase family protein [Rhodococcus sp. WS4]|nr:enoyl-CoA hydratase/isomerase family protein [Rhodococcus sp. WS4]
MTSASFSRQGDVGVITLTNPPQNRLSSDLVDEFAKSVVEVSTAGVRSLVVRGDGDTFCFGANIADWPDLSDSDLRTFIHYVNRVFQQVEELPIPTIAAVHGSCMGGGFELALHCDLIVAADDANFRFPEATLAIPPLAGGVQRLAERVGRSTAARLVLLTDPVTGEEGARLGFVARTAPADDVYKVALEIAHGFAEGPTLAYQSIKSILRGWAQGGLGAADRLQLDISDAPLRSQDFDRGVSNAIDAFKRGVPRPILNFLGQ